LINMNLALKIFTAFVLLSASLARQIMNKGWSPRGKLGECQGDCDRDSDCLGNLRCFHRDFNQAVPGCYGYKIYGYDYCIRPRPQPGLPRYSGPLKLHKCYRFESVNFKGEHMRHRNYQLWKDSGRGALYWKDSTFKVVPALTGFEHQVSFESLNYPHHYLTHYGYKGYISRLRTDLDMRDASWTVQNGFVYRYCKKTVSFQSANYREYYLRHQNARVRISRRSYSTLYRLDASWVYHEVSCKRNFFYLGRRNGNC